MAKRIATRERRRAEARIDRKGQPPSSWMRLSIFLPHLSQSLYGFSGRPCRGQGVDRNRNLAHRLVSQGRVCSLGGVYHFQSGHTA
jgi:hypothetical protein